MTKKKVYSQEGVDEAVEKYTWGMTLRALCEVFPKFTSSAKNRKDGVKAKLPGPLPILPVEIEYDLKAWIVGMHCQGILVSRMTYFSKEMNSFIQCLGTLIKLVHCNVNGRADWWNDIQYCSCKLRKLSTLADSLFHLIVVACFGTYGFAVPWVLFVPCQCHSRDMMDGGDGWYFSKIILIHLYRKQQ